MNAIAPRLWNFRLFAICASAALLLSPRGAQADFFSNPSIPESERTGARLVYQLDTPSTSPQWSGTTPVPYSTNNTAFIAPSSYARLGYYVEVTSGAQAGEWVYVSFAATGNTPGAPAFTSASTIGLPHSVDNAIARQQLVTSANIYSSLASASLTQGPGIGTVNVEMWPSSYNMTAGATIPGGSSASFDFDDGGFTTAAGHGTFQVHNYGEGKTLFGLSRWGGNATGGGNIDFGVGNSSTAANLDWTSLGTGATGRIQIVVSGAVENFLSTSGNWAIGSNWTTAAEPTTTEYAYVGGGLTTTVNTAGRVAGALIVGHNQATLPGNGTLNLNAPGALSVAESIFLGEGNTTGAINLTGGGSLSFGGNITSRGTDSITGGTISVSSQRTLDVANSLSITSNFSGAGGITKAGQGTLNLTGNLGHTGNTIVNGGEVVYNGTSTLSGASSVIIGNGSGTSGTFTLQSGSLTIDKSGASNATAPGNINGLRVGNGNGSTGTLNITGGTLTVGTAGNGSEFLVGFSTVTANPDAVGVVNLSGGTLNIGVGGGRTFIGGGNSLAADGNGTLNLSGNAVLNVAPAGAFPNNLLYLGGYGGTGNLNIDGGTIILQRGIGTGGTGSINVMQGGATIDTNGATVTVSSVIAGSGPIVKNGAGTLGLTGANTFSGSLTANAGTLLLGTGGNNSNWFAGSPDMVINSGATMSFSGYNVFGLIPATMSQVTINSGGTLLTSGTGANFVTVFNNLTLNNATATVNNNDGFGVTWGTMGFAGTTTATGNSAIALQAGSTGTIAIGSGNAGFGTFTVNTPTASDSLSVAPVMASTLAVVKNGAGTLTLTAANTYTGSTTVNGGTLSLTGAGASGAAASSSGYTLNSSGTMLLNNTSAANNTNRIGAVTVTMNGGTLNFSHNAGAVNYSEATGALSVAAGASSVVTSQAAAGQTSALTFASLSRTAGAMINFSGTGLGASTRNQVVFTAAPTLSNGLIGPWATYNGTDFATYSGGSVAQYASYTNINALGWSITSGATTNVRISAAGAGGNISMAAGTTTINTLLQSTGTAATVDTASKTLQTSAIMIGAGQANLTIGTTAGSGALTAATSGGELNLINHSTSTLTVNSVINNNALASSLTKSGAGTVVIASSTTNYTGATTVNAGTLRLTNVTSFNSPVAVGAQGVLEFNSIAANDATPDWSYNKALTGGGTVNKTGPGWFFITTGSVNMTGQINVTDGIWSNSSTAGISWAGNTAGLDVASIAKFDVYGNNTIIGALTGSGNVIQTNTTVSTTPNLSVGNGGGSGTFSGNITQTAGTLSFTKNGAGTQTLSGANTYTGITTVNGGTLTLSSTGSLSLNGGFVVTGAGSVANIQGTVANTGSPATAPMTVSSGGTINFSGTGTTANSTGAMQISSGTFNMTGGSLTTTWTSTNGWGIGNAATGILNISGGKINVSGDDVFLVGWSGAGVGLMNLSGGELNITGSAALIVSSASTTTGTVNLNAGGLLSSGRNIATGAGAGTSTFNFNGGTLKALNSISMSGLTRANVRDGGVIIDTNGTGNTVTIGQALLHSNIGGDADIDGGLTKNGGGILTLSGANTYTGITQVNAGNLRLSQAGNPATVLKGAIYVNNGGTLSFGSYNQLGGSGSTVTAPVTVNAGGVVDSSATVNSFNNLTLNGGTLSSTGGFSALWRSFVLFGTLDVTANSSILNTSGSNNGISPGGFNGNQLLTINVSPGVTLTNNLPLVNYDATHVYSLTKTGAGTATFSANSTYTGPTIVRGGMLELTGGGQLSGTSSISVGTAAGSGTLLLNTTGAHTLGTGSVTLGSGVEVVTGTLNMQAAAGTTVSVTNNLVVGELGVGDVNHTTASTLDIGNGAASGDLIIGQTGFAPTNRSTYDLTASGGAVIADNIFVGMNTPSVAAQDHQLNISGVGATVTARTDLKVGYGGRGTVNQTGTNSVVNINGATTFTVGDAGVGVYNLNAMGGLVDDDGSAFIGTNAGNGAMNHDLGTVSIDLNLTVGNGAGSTGAYIMANNLANALTVSGNEFVGVGTGVGTFTQNGGTHTLNGTGGSGGNGNLTVGASGQFNLHGGTLDFQDYAAGGATAWTPDSMPNQASTITVPTASQFLFDGGTLKDVSNISVGGGLGTFEQRGGDFYIGQMGVGPAALTTINGGFSLLDGTLHLDIFGDDLTPEECCDNVASNNDQLTVMGDALLDSTISLNYVGGYEPEFGDVFTLLCADNIDLGPGFYVDGGFFRIVPSTGDPNGPMALQAIVPEPASVAVWTLIGLVGFVGAYRSRRRLACRPLCATARGSLAANSTREPPVAM